MLSLRVPYGREWTSSLLPPEAQPLLWYKLTFHGDNAAAFSYYYIHCKLIFFCFL